MLILNKLFQKARILVYTQFKLMRYLQSDAISVLFIEKANMKNFVRDHSNMLIKSVKSIDKKVIRIAVLEY